MIAVTDSRGKLACNNIIVRYQRHFPHVIIRFYTEAASSWESINKMHLPRNRQSVRYRKSASYYNATATVLITIALHQKGSFEIY